MDIHIKLLVSFISFLVSIVLFIVAWFVFGRHRNLDKRCSMKETGKVVNYSQTTNTEGIRLPVVEYIVDKQVYYQKGPRYCWVISKSSRSPWQGNRIELKEDGLNLKVIYHKNAMVSAIVNPIQLLYPLGCQLDVYYDPHNPKISFVKRYRKKFYHWGFWLTFGTSIFLLLSMLLIIWLN